MEVFSQQVLFPLLILRQLQQYSPIPVSPNRTEISHSTVRSRYIHSVLQITVPHLGGAEKGTELFPVSLVLSPKDY